VIFVNQNIKYLREQSKYSQSNIASKINISVKNYQWYEKNIEPPFEVLFDLSTLHNVSLHDLCFTDLTGKQKIIKKEREVNISSTMLYGAFNNASIKMQKHILRLLMIND